MKIESNLEKGKVQSNIEKVKDLKNGDNYEELRKAQEINFAKVLAGNDKRLRDKAVKKLMKWLSVRSRKKCGFTEENFDRIWTGLFYCMWMSDKFLVQEDLAESISKLIHCFQHNKESALLFIKGFYKIMNLEWSGIDQHRIDKFNMLVRRFLRQTIEYCRRKEWEEELVKQVTIIFEDKVLNLNAPIGYVVHFIDIFPEEFAKVTKGKISNETIAILFEPFVKLMGTSKDMRIHKAVNLFFQHLIRQTDIGIEYEEKLQTWKKMGMPCARPEELQLCVEHDSGSDDSELDETTENGPLDPRAGKVDVFLPQIPIDFDVMVSIIKKHQNTAATTLLGRKALFRLAKKFMRLKAGKAPDNIIKPKILSESKKRRFTLKCAKDLIEFTKKLDQDESGSAEMAKIEIDSDSDNDQNTSDMSKVKGAEVKKKRKAKKLRNSENSENLKTKKIKLEEKKKKKKKRKPHLEEKKEVEKKILTNGVIKSKDKKDVKPKSCNFVIEDIGKQSKALTTASKKKRKVLSSWQVHDLNVDSEEYNKIKVPKIIKLETKIKSPLPVEKETSEKVVICKTLDEPEEKSTPQVMLTPSFWDKAKEKAFKNRKSKSTLLMNPLYVGDEAKSSKRISFALHKNEAQENEEYLQEVRNSPSIPFDGSRKPVQSALKSGLAPSPINPFYRFKKMK